LSSRKNDPLSANDQPGLYESAETVVVEIEEETVNETNPPAEQNDEPAIEDVSPDPVALLQEIQQLQAEKNELRDRALRAQAELDNFRKRSRQQQMEQLQYANERLIADLLSVIDNFERALKSGGENGDIGSWKAGVQMIARQLVEVLEQSGLKPVRAHGQQFDPALHEAIGSIVTQVVPEGQIVEELQKGYLLHDRLLRPSKVHLASAPCADDNACPSGG